MMTEFKFESNDLYLEDATLRLSKFRHVNGDFSQFLSLKGHEIENQNVFVIYSYNKLLYSKNILLI